MSTVFDISVLRVNKTIAVLSGVRVKLSSTVCDLFYWFYEISKCILSTGSFNLLYFDKWSHFQSTLFNAILFSARSYKVVWTTTKKSFKDGWTDVTCFRWHRKDYDYSRYCIPLAKTLKTQQQKEIHTLYNSRRKTQQMVRNISKYFQSCVLSWLI